MYLIRLETAILVSRILPDSRFPIPDSRFPIPDSRFPIPCSLIPSS
ncbi:MULTISPECIES: hypothetical protein [Moorena]|nr:MULTISPECIES: hypothetical protein [Moorena]NEP32683.1 hypothetical protein [Moorena sp. SIO3B2]NEP66135.1 hypothetical protein [Moorena sp. SIO3A5]NEQ04980.1 hypothetical protein [Moorena sp. SIO4E2]NER90699.1 hypothetical protein [Moorena sp. SIO3A2]